MIYEIKYGGVLVSKGKITAVSGGGELTFTPDAGSPGPKDGFTGTFSSGYLKITSIPTASGNITGVDASPEGGTDSGDNGGSSPSTPPDNTQPTVPSTPPLLILVRILH